MNTDEIIREILGGQAEAEALVQVVEMLEDKIANQDDETARDYYRQITLAIADLQAAVADAESFYN